MKLKELFSAYKPISVEINKRRKGCSFCHVTFKSEEIQKQAIKEMNGKEIEGQEIFVSVFIEKSNKGANGPSKASIA